MATKRHIVKPRIPVTPGPFPSTDDLKELLALAGVPASKQRAANSWLRAALDGARRAQRAADQRPKAANHNAVLDGIQKASTKLFRQIERLRRYPATWGAFWHSQAFAPIDISRDGEDNVTQLLRRLERAAVEVRDSRLGRRRAAGKQAVVDHALWFFVRYSPAEPSGTPTGPFATFARQFYAVAAGVPTAGYDIDRQIRVAAERAPLLRERARQMSIKKSRDLS